MLQDPVDGEPAVLVKLYNVTQQKQMEAELQTQKEALARSDAQLSVCVCVCLCLCLSLCACVYIYWHVTEAAVVRHLYCCATFQTPDNHIQTLLSTAWTARSKHPAHCNSVTQKRCLQICARDATAITCLLAL